MGEERDEARAEKIVREAWDEPVGEERDEARAEMIRRLDTARLIVNRASLKTAHARVSALIAAMRQEVAK